MNDETLGMTSAQIEQYNQANRLITQWREIGKEASRLLYAARDSVPGVDWFDHRHHMLNPAVEFTDFWTASGESVVSRIPIDGTVLDLCCGDGFYDYHFYRHKAKSILGIDINAAAIALARREHSAPNIEYVIADVMEYPLAKSRYDVVVCRGAIEHFTCDEQQEIFDKVGYTLVPGGWFCGDTFVVSGSNEAHKHEWKNEGEMNDALKSVFTNVESSVIISRERTTLLWRAQA
jgi:SAM-dependent methyltransferase